MNSLIDCPETVTQIAMTLERCESQFEEAFLEKTALYRCFNSQDELLYVGVSYSATNRNFQHKKTSMCAKDVVVIHIVGNGLQYVPLMSADFPVIKIHV